MKNLGFYLTSGIYPPDKGGPAQFVSEYSRWLSERVPGTKVISLKDGPSIHEATSNRNLVLTSRDKRMPIRMLGSIYAVATPWFSKKLILMNGLFLEVLIASFITRLRIVAKIPGDIVWERARNQGKTILSIDEYQGHEEGLKKLFRFFFTLSLKRAKVVISPSLHLKTLMESWGVKSNKIVLVRNSVDTQFFAPDPSHTKKYDVITVCRLVPWKGVEEIIKVCADKNLSLAVVGDGPDQVHLREIAAKTGAKVEFLGDRPHTQMPQLLNSARVFVLNSQYEGSPHSLIEALSVGLVSVARESTGSAEVIRDKENGLLCGKSRTLGEALSIAFEVPKLSEKMRAGARITALTDFDRKKNFQDILDVLKRVS